MSRIAPGPNRTATSISGSNCSTPTVMSRWRRCRSRSRWTSRAISGRSSSFPSPTSTRLYGVEVIELNVWRPLVTHLEEQLALGRPAIVEVDAFYLPDTWAPAITPTTSRRRSPSRRSMWPSGGSATSTTPVTTSLPAAISLVCSGSRRAPIDASAALRGGREVRRRRSAASVRRWSAASLELLRAHLDRRPHDNPFRRFAGRALRPISNGWPTSRSRTFMAMPSPRSGNAARRSSSAAPTCAGSSDTASATSNDSRLPATSSPRPPRRCSSGPRASSTHAERSILRRCSTVMAEAWDETMTGLAARYSALAHQG